ncbi:MAG: DUF1549 domain-containing protein [Blastocatellia bacterium]|nr:DUF1549 domain-containing protein [Blastocatellia bacterium]
MPQSGTKRIIDGPGRVKRAVLLTALIAAALVLADRAGWMGSPQAAGDGQRKTGQESTKRATIDDCSFLQDPDKYKEALAEHREELSRSTELISQARMTEGEAPAALVPPQNIPRKNLIDNILFDRMARDGVMSAAICTDEEFIRRVTLDVTGRIPSADDVTNFVKDTATNKRDALVDKLLASPEFVDKWTMFFGDLFKNNARSVNVQRYSGGRDAFYNYIKSSIAANKSYAQMATEMITANGDNFVAGEVNFVIGGIVPMGPAQDTMDGSAVNAASMFLGISALDCLLCHDGAGHLDAVNLWGSQRTRADAWSMSAFFARVRRQRQVLSQMPNYAKYIVSEQNAGEYQLNTNFGNRSDRAPIDGKTTADPKYIFTGQGLNQGENRRQALARHITSDIQFSRAAVNYIWEKIMVEAFVSPSNAFDPARLDPAATLPQGWMLQPTNPELLSALATEFKNNGHNIRSLIGLITKSSAYQLSAQYPGNWSLALVPYYARKYVRRMDAEEIHDAILKATGIGVTYQMRDTLNANTFTVNWAMQLPDPAEPRGNANVINFLNSFIRGDRDVKPRSLEPSIQQALNMMNNNFVMTRIHQNNAGSLVARLLANSSLTTQEIITQLYLNTLSRNPTQAELNALTPIYTSSTKQAATEGIQWALINKMDFIFNY